MSLGHAPVMAQDNLQTLQHMIWSARLPLEIRLAASESRSFNEADPYLVGSQSASYYPQCPTSMMRDSFNQRFTADEHRPHS